ncbi:MAG: DUF5602 domain-containing protein [Armatimonadota bacterium]
MMNRLRLIFAFVSFAVVMTAQIAVCAPKEHTYTGPKIKIGMGYAYSWVMYDASAKPASMGISLNEAALSALPGDGEHVEYVLRLPKQAPKPYTHAVINWNPKGHIPVEVYGLPHFDFHFYMISPSVRKSITAKGKDLIKVGKAPPAKYLPKDYFFAPGSEEPRMGSHWVDKYTPELNGDKFTMTFIYGFYDGKMNFLEPMVSMEYLKSKPDATERVKQPESFLKSGYYPTTYSVAYNAKTNEYSISLNKMVRK